MTISEQGSNITRSDLIDWPPSLTTTWEHVHTSRALNINAKAVVVVVAALAACVHMCVYVCGEGGEGGVTRFPGTGSPVPAIVAVVGVAAAVGFPVGPVPVLPVVVPVV